MATLAYLLVWAGYSVFTLGVANVRGCNVTWSQIALPGKFKGCNPDGPAGQGATVGTSAGATVGQALAGTGSTTTRAPGVPTGSTALGRT